MFIILFFMLLISIVECLFSASAASGMKLLQILIFAIFAFFFRVPQENELTPKNVPAKIYSTGEIMHTNMTYRILAL